MVNCYKENRKRRTQRAHDTLLVWFYLCFHESWLHSGYFTENVEQFLHQGFLCFFFLFYEANRSPSDYVFGLHVSRSTIYLSKSNFYTYIDIIYLRKWKVGIFFLAGNYIFDSMQPFVLALRAQRPRSPWEVGPWALAPWNKGREDSRILLSLFKWTKRAVSSQACCRFYAKKLLFYFCYY